MIIYIHGFGGSGSGSKASAFRAYFQGRPFLAPSLSYIPELAIQTLEELVEQCSDREPVGLIGSSLGGFYAMYLSQKYGVPAVLLNPAVQPYETLKGSMGRAPSFYDGSTFEWNEKHLQTLHELDGDVADQSRLLLMVQTGDELLDYRDALRKLPQAKQLVIEGGNHGFDGVEKHFEAIVSFLYNRGHSNK